MSTTSYNPNETHAHPVGMPLKQSPTSRGFNVANMLVPPPSPRSIQHDSNYAYGHSQVPDNDLITAAQGGDQEAFVALCRRHSSVAKKKIRRIVRNQEDAEDAFQDMLLRAYTHLASFRRSCKFSTWITCIGVNSALMILRKRKVRNETYGLVTLPDARTPEVREQVDQSPGPERIYLKRQASLIVRREVQKLQPTLRSIVARYYGSEDSLEESARALDISLSAAKSRLLRGRLRLRSSLARHGLSDSSFDRPL